MSTVKATNPKDFCNSKKVPFHVIPFQVLSELGLALLEGALKYGAYNWRVAGVRASVYMDAQVGRHLAAYWEGEDIDPESGISHITKAIAGLVILRDSMIQGNYVDDRPPKGQSGWIQELNAKAAALVEKYPTPVEPFTELGEQAKKAKV